MQKLLLIPILVLATIPAVALGQPPTAGKAASDCATQLTSMGAATFKQTYSPNGSARSAIAKCVTRFTLVENQNVNNAAKACRAEQAQMTPQDFAAKYGTNGSGRNAFGKCVSSKARQSSTEDVKATINAATACKSERKDPNFASSHSGQTFAQFYGKGKQNAFGKCVTAKAKDAEQNP